MTVRQLMTTIEVLDPTGQVQKLAAVECNPVMMPLRGLRLGIGRIPNRILGAWQPWSRRDCAMMGRWRT